MCKNPKSDSHLKLIRGAVRKYRSVDISSIKLPRDFLFVCQYSERLDLGLIKSMGIESPYKNKGPTIFTLSLPLEDVQLKVCETSS